MGLIRHFDFGYTVVAEVASHHVDFKVYSIFSTSVDGGTVEWKTTNEHDVHVPTTSLEEADPYLHGFVKWDGCSNWHFDEQDNVMLHGCSREDLVNIGAIMAACWDWTKELLPNFCG